MTTVFEALKVISFFRRSLEVLNDTGGDARSDIKSVPVRENGLSAKMELLLVSKLAEEYREGLSSGLSRYCICLAVSGVLSGRGGIGSSGASPDCWLQRLTDLDTGRGRVGRSKLAPLCRGSRIEGIGS